MKRWLDLVGLALVGLFVGVALVIVVAPFVFSFVMSFDPRSYLGPLPPPGVSGRWYAKFFSDERYMRALWTSLGIALLTGVLATTLGTLAALGLTRLRGPKHAFFDGVFASPRFVPNVVTGFAILLAFSAAGVGAGFLSLTSVHVLLTLPLVVRSVAAALLGIRPSLVEAAILLGATPTRAVFDIVLPLARTGIAVGFVFSIAISLDEVAASVFLTTTDVVTLPVMLISDMKANFDLTIAAASVLLMLFIAAVVVCLDLTIGIERLFGRGAYGGGVKK